MTGPENKELRQLLSDRIRERGKISFAEFMEWALYHPEHGYYHSAREKIGPRGDYYTSPNVHPVFGCLLARQLRQMWEILGAPPSFTIAEMGGGRGLLCSDILQFCRGHLPDFFKVIRYLLVEKSRSFREEQENLLKEFRAGDKVRWMAPEDFLQGREPMAGCLLSNELVDSFPVHLVKQEGNQLKEIYVVLDGGGDLSEVLAPPSTTALNEYLDAYGFPLRDGQRAEINLSALEWMEGVNRALHRGFVLTIDYGYEAAELYHPQRFEGTLLSYFRHTTSANPYQRLGYQDITAHVNFTALMRKGETLGLRREGYTQQYRFLTALGLLEDLENLEKDSARYSPSDFMRNKLAMKSFLVPGAMGALFKVLAQSKGVAEVHLQGFSDPFSPRIPLKWKKI